MSDIPHQLQIVNKWQAAIRQLDTAVKLFFDDGDEVSIHTLACAAHDILRHYGGKQGAGSMEEELKKVVKPQYKKFVIDILREPQNFFKHPGPPLKTKIKFTPSFTDMILFDSIGIYYKIVKKSVPKNYQAYRLWFYANYQEFVIFVPEERKRFDQINKIAGKSRKLYLEAVSRLST